MSQRQWLEEKHANYLSKLDQATTPRARVELCTGASRDFQRSTVEWDRTFELIHDWLTRAHASMPAPEELECLEPYAVAVAGAVETAVFYDTHVAQSAGPSTRALATIEHLEWVHTASLSYPNSPKVVRAAAEAMAQVYVGSLRCSYGLQFDPYARLELLAWEHLGANPHGRDVLRCYLDASVERLADTAARSKGDARRLWDEFREFVEGIEDRQASAGAYAKAVLIVARDEVIPEPLWLGEQLERVARWWSGEPGWMGIRADLYEPYGALLKLAIQSAPDEGKRERYEQLHEEYVEDLPDWE
ncbi:MAG: hypothetical protein AAF658_09675 [Myxococcota bacterium]